MEDGLPAEQSAQERRGGVGEDAPSAIQAIEGFRGQYQLFQLGRDAYGERVEWKLPDYTGWLPSAHVLQLPYQFP